MLNGRDYLTDALPTVRSKVGRHTHELKMVMMRNTALRIKKQDDHPEPQPILINSQRSDVLAALTSRLTLMLMGVNSEEHGEGRQA